MPRAGPRFHLRFATPVLLCVLAAGCAPPRKLLLFCREMPAPETLRARAEAFYRLPFDGLVLDLPTSDGGRSLAWRVWSREPVPSVAITAAEAALAASRYRGLRDSFLRVNAMPGDVAWGDPAWKGVAENAALAASAARRLGLRGLVLDTEQYGEHRPFDYDAQPEGRSFAEHAEAARGRGREMAASIGAAFPDVTLLVLFAHTLPYRRVGGSDAYPVRVPDAALAGVEYGLLAPFLDGMLEGLPPRATYVDAYESAYPYRERLQFSRARGLIHDGAAATSRVPELYRSRVRAGFGLWLDFESDKTGWSAADPSRNHFTPEGFGQVVRAALAESDGYVWIYSEKPDWISGRDLPDAYVRALRAARY